MKEIRDVISEGVSIRKGKRVVRLTQVTVMFRGLRQEGWRCWAEGGAPPWY